MPRQKRHTTKYPGVYFIEGTQAGTGKPEKIFYISFYKDDRKIEEKAGRQYANDMSAARANVIRGQKIDGTQPTNKERRQALEAEKKARAGRWTIDKLWTEYSKGKKENKGFATDLGRYNKFLMPAFGNLEPIEIDSLSVERMKRGLLKTKSDQTVAHILSLLIRIINFGVNNGLCQGLSFKIKKPRVNNVKTEDLNEDQLQRLFKAIERDTHPAAGPMMKLVLFTGMRRGEIFKLKWRDLYIFGP